MPDLALRLRRLSKAFGNVRAVDSLDLDVPRGTTYGFIGPSGAGKTTCIRMIMSIIFPDEGELSVLGHRSSLEAKDRIGYLPEERGVYRRMRVGQFLSYIGQLKGVSETESRTRADRLLDELGLPDVTAKRCEDLSKGMLHRVQFVAAVINQPELLILDEPFSGLDPVSVRRMKDVIGREQERGATILFSTHVMTQAEELCEHVVMIHNGQKVLDEAMMGLRRQFDPQVIRLQPLHLDADLTVLSGLPGVAGVRPSVEGVEVLLDRGVDPADAMQRIASHVSPARIELARVTLEDVFVRLVSGRRDDERERSLRANLQDLDAEPAT